MDAEKFIQALKSPFAILIWIAFFIGCMFLARAGYFGDKLYTIGRNLTGPIEKLDCNNKDEPTNLLLEIWKENNLMPEFTVFQTDERITLLISADNAYLMVFTVNDDGQVKNLTGIRSIEVIKEFKCPLVITYPVGKESILAVSSKCPFEEEAIEKYLGNNDGHKGLTEPCRLQFPEGFTVNCLTYHVMENVKAN